MIKWLDLLFIRKGKLEIISTAKKKLSTVKRKPNVNQDVSEFKNKVKERPYYFFVAFNRCLYKKYVKQYVKQSVIVKSINSLYYTCLTCNKKIVLF